MCVVLVVLSACGFVGHPTPRYYSLVVEVSESKTRSVPATSEEIVEEVYRGLRLCNLIREDTKVCMVQLWFLLIP